jgi:hypothetical protein
MKYFIPKDITITDSSIPENTDELGVMYPIWDKVSTQEEGKIISYQGSLFQSRTNIYPLATYSWNDVANNIAPVVTRLEDNVIIIATSVPCVQNVTVIYVKDTWKEGAANVKGKFFKYTGVSGSLDLTNVEPATITDFIEIDNYRKDANEPTVGSNTIYWKYLGRTNRNKVTDKSYTSVSTVANTTEVWFEFQALNPDNISIFNIQTPKAKIIVYSDDINSPLYENTKEQLIDTTSITNWRTLSQYTPIYIRNTSWKLPFFVGAVTVRIVLFSTVPTTIKIGEILSGKDSNLAITMDGVPTTIKSSGTITELDNGDVVLEDEGDTTKIFLIYNFSLMYPSKSHDEIVDKCTELIRRRIVISAEDSDDPKYKSMVFYGFVREASPTLQSNSLKSNIQFQAQRFK